MELVFSFHSRQIPESDKDDPIEDPDFVPPAEDEGSFSSSSSEDDEEAELAAVTEALGEFGLATSKSQENNGGDEKMVVAAPTATEDSSSAMICDVPCPKDAEKEKDAIVVAEVAAEAGIAEAIT